MKGMIVFGNSVIFLLFINEFSMCVCLIWEKMPCSADEVQTMPEGIEKNTGRFPWLGILQHSFDIGGTRGYAISGIVLVHPRYAIGGAEDVSKINPSMLVNNTEMIFWESTTKKYALPVQDYVLHPEFTNNITSATIALVSIINPIEADFNEFAAPVKPICMPMGIGTYTDMYAVKFTDESGDLQKEVTKMNYIDKQECDNFYIRAELHYDRMNPTNPLCALSANSTSACVWDSGTALITRQSWGFWQLIGFAVRGPGCGAPTKFLSMADYVPWISDVIQSAAYLDVTENEEGEEGIGFRRLSPTKLVFYPASATLPRYMGQCHPDTRGRTLFRDTSIFVGNRDFVQGFYLASVTQHASFLCGEVNLHVARRTNAVMWVENHCRRAMEGVITDQQRSGDLERLECFQYFKSTAYIEFKFTFSFKGEFTIAMYGHLGTLETIYLPPRKLITTSWWPTTGKLRMNLFYPSNKLWMKLE